MQCSMVKQQLEQLAATETLPLATRVHINHCADCRDHREQRQLQQLLGSLPAPEPSEDFTSRVINQAWAENNEVQKQTPPWRWLAATAASITLAVFLTLQLTNIKPADTTGTLADRGISADMTQPVSVLFSTGKALEGATITVSLPSNLALEGYPNQQQLRWTTDLKAGDTKLTLPVKFTQTAELETGQNEILIKLEHGGKQKEFRVPVRQTSSTLSSESSV